MKLFVLIGFFTNGEEENTWEYTIGVYSSYENAIKNATAKNIMGESFIKEYFWEYTQVETPRSPYIIMYKCERSFLGARIEECILDETISEAYDKSLERW